MIQKLTRIGVMLVAISMLLLAGSPGAQGAGTGNMRDEVVWKVATQQKAIALTFDDGPDPRYTPQILDILKEYHASATFFVLGSHVQEYPWIAKRTVNEGHELANHTYSHPLIPTITQEQLQDELTKTRQVILDTTGQYPHFFRPPQGKYNRMVISTAKKFGYKIVLWSSVDTRDWSRPGVQAIVNTVVQHAQNGYIVLLHDYGGDRSQTVEALKVILPKLEEQGFQFVTMSELMQMGSTEHVK